MLTERDVMRALLPSAVVAVPEESGGPAPESGGEPLEVRREAGSLSVGECMTRPAVSVAETADVREAVRLMLSRQLKRLPVVSEDGQVVGVVNRVDIIQAIFEENL